MMFFNANAQARFKILRISTLIKVDNFQKLKFNYQRKYSRKIWVQSLKRAYKKVVIY